MLWCDQNSLSNGVYDERIWNFFFLKKFVPFLKILLYFGKIWNIYFLRKNRILYTLRVCHLLAQPLSLPSFCRIHSNMQLGVFNIWTHFEGLSCSNKGLRKFDPFGIEKNICKCWQSLCQVCRNDIFTACHGHLVPCPIACLAWKLRLAAGGSGRRLPPVWVAEGLHALGLAHYAPYARTAYGGAPEPRSAMWWLLRIYLHNCNFCTFSIGFHHLCLLRLKEQRNSIFQQ